MAHESGHWIHLQQLKDGQWLQSGNPVMEPPRAIIEAIFGRSQFPAGMGLYGELTVLPELPDEMENHITVKVLTAEGSMRGFVGVFVVCKGFPYLICLTDKIGVSDMGFATAIHQIKQQWVFCGDNISHQLNLLWD